MANVNIPRPGNKTCASITMSTTSTGESDALALGGSVLSAVQISSSWTTAALGFKGNVDNSSDYYFVKDSLGNFLTYAASAAQVLVFDPAPFKGLSKLVLVSMTTAGVAVAQNSARALKVGLSSEK